MRSELTDEIATNQFAEQEGMMSAPARKEIIVLGDGLSDIDGPGVKGYGPGRTFASVWTRALRAYIDPPKSQRGSNPLQRFERFNVYRGGRAYGGTELAVSGQTTKQGNDALDKVLNQVRNPAMVVIAYTGVTDVGKISITQAKKNPENMVERALASGASVLLIRFPKPNDTGHWDAKDKKNGPTIQFLDALNAFYGELYNRFKKSGKVGFISDFYESLRVNGAVPRNIVRAGLDVVADAADEYKLFDHVFRTMGPILDPAYKPPKTDRKAIMVVGDHLSDIDGPNTRGYGGDRAQSIWTRGLIKLVDGVKGGKNPNPYYVYDGGRAGGGSELAASAASTTVQLNFLRRALQTTRPGVVVIAASYINEEQLSAETTFSNIREMVALAKSVGAKILLIGFPPASKDYDKKTADRATALANGYKSIAKREKLSYVEDFFAPIRGSDGFVIPNLLTRDRGLFRSEATEQKLFDNIFKELAPLLGMKPPSSGGDFGKPKNPPTASKRTIMVVGDHYADVDGPGAGKGSGRNASIWTRELLARSASQNYRVIEGGEGNGGSELAMGGGASAWQK